MVVLTFKNACFQKKQSSIDIWNFVFFGQPGTQSQQNVASLGSNNGLKFDIIAFSRLN